MKTPALQARLRETTDANKRRLLRQLIDAIENDGWPLVYYDRNRPLQNSLCKSFIKHD